MKSSDSFFKRNTLFNIIFLFFVLIVDFVLLFILSVNKHNRCIAYQVPLEDVATCFSSTQQETLSVDTARISSLLKWHPAYLMLLDEKGDLLWSMNMPKSLPQHYDTAELIADSKQLYQRYPTATYSLNDDLLVLRYVPHGICLFHGFVHPTHFSFITFLHTIFSSGMLLIVLLNVILSILMYMRNSSRLKKVIRPILNSVDDLVASTRITSPETDELSDICATLNQATKYILQKNEAQAEWISGVSHDIRTPLSCILGYSTEIEEDSALPADTREQAHVIRVQAEKLRRLVGNLNLVSQLEYSMQPVNLSLTDPAELVRNVLVEFIESNPGSQFSFDFEMDPPVETLLNADAMMLHRMLENIIQNSITHNPNGCDIVVTLQAKANNCVFTICDNGTGIPADRLAELNSGVFFEKTHSVNSSVPHGLGLRLIKNIVTVHHGSLSFSAVSPHGLCTTVSLPFSRGGKASAYPQHHS